MSTSGCGRLCFRRFFDGGRCDCSFMGIGEVYETSRFDKFRELHRDSCGGYLVYLATNPICSFDEYCRVGAKIKSCSGSASADFRPSIRIAVRWPRLFALWWLAIFIYAFRKPPVKSYMDYVYEGWLYPKLEEKARGDINYTES